jgi:hypothetical protein
MYTVNVGFINGNVIAVQECMWDRQAEVVELGTKSI